MPLASSATSQAQLFIIFLFQSRDSQLLLVIHHICRYLPYYWKRQERNSRTAREQFDIQIRYKGTKWEKTPVLWRDSQFLPLLFIIIVSPSYLPGCAPSPYCSSRCEQLSFVTTSRTNAPAPVTLCDQCYSTVMTSCQASPCSVPTPCWIGAGKVASLFQCRSGLSCPSTKNKPCLFLEYTFSNICPSGIMNPSF